MPARLYKSIDERQIDKVDKLEKNPVAATIYDYLDGGRRSS
jgi:hypothetical protein